MKFYAACLASYNNGVLHGVWIEAESDVDSMQDAINAMLRDSKFPNVRVTCPDCEGDSETQPTCTTCKGIGTVPSAEEWAIHDTDGLPSSLGEYCGLQAIAEYMEFVERVGSETGTDNVEELAQSLFEEFGSIEYAANELQNFIGIYDSFREYADECADDMIACHSADGKVSEFFVNYFDYNSYAHDLKHETTVIDLPCGSVAIFRQ